MAMDGRGMPFHLRLSLLFLLLQSVSSNDISIQEIASNGLNEEMLSRPAIFVPSSSSAEQKQTEVFRHHRLAHVSAKRAQELDLMNRLLKKPLYNFRDLFRSDFH